MERNTRIEEELFPFYALDALSQEERDEVERYVSGNPEAQARLIEAMSAATEFVADLEPISPSPAVKQRLLARIEAASAAAPVETPRAAARQATTSTSAKRRWWPIGLKGFYFGRALGFAVLLLLVGAFGLWQMTRQVSQLRSQVGDLQARVVQLEGETARLQSEAGVLRIENDALRNELAASQDLLARYRQPGMTTIAIGDASGAHPTAVGTLTFDPTTSEGMLNVANLPPLPAGSTYQAWLMVDETLVSAGMFTVDEQGAGTHPISNITPDALQGVGVSMEPEGGNEQPTPDNIILFGGFS
jgi:anti-sigma-K factor RskA